MPAHPTDPVADVAARIPKWQRDPAAFIREFFGATLWSKQIEICESVEAHKETVVASCHESGKTWLSARLAWWWALCFRGSRVITTGPSKDQLEGALWGEIRDAYAEMIRQWGTDFGLPPPGKTRWEKEPKWDMLGFTTTPDTAQQHAARFTGYHSPHNLVIFDEASGIHRIIWRAASGLMTSEHYRFLAIGNPADPSGPFFDAFVSPDTNAIVIDGYECPNVVAKRNVMSWGITWEYVQKERRFAGSDYENDAAYQFKVRGSFPSSAYGNLIGIAEIDRAIEREPDPLLGRRLPISIGIDVAYQGDDRTAFVVVRDTEIIHAEGHANREPMWIAGRTIELCHKYGIRKQDAHLVAIDDTGGYGSGPSSRLHEQGWGIRRVSFAGRPEADRDAERYLNIRALLWWNLREWIVHEACLSTCPRDVARELRLELSAPKKDVTSTGKRKLEPKDKIKERIGRSPDYGDALALALYHRVFAPAFSVNGYVPADRGVRTGKVDAHGDPIGRDDFEYEEDRGLAGLMPDGRNPWD